MELSEIIKEINDLKEKNKKLESKLEYMNKNLQTLRGGWFRFQCEEQEKERKSLSYKLGQIPFLRRWFKRRV